MLQAVRFSSNETRQARELQYKTLKLGERIIDCYQREWDSAGEGFRFSNYSQSSQVLGNLAAFADSLGKFAREGYVDYKA